MANKDNKMREIEIEKIVFNCSGTEDKLDRSVKLLEIITGRKPKKIKAKRRIPGFGISPAKFVGCKVTIREKDKIEEFLRRIFTAVGNRLRKKMISQNHFGVGVKEYIEVPGIEYQRELGMLGFEVDVSFKRKGKRVIQKKIKRGKYPKKQHITPKEIIEYLNKKFKVEVV